MGLLSAYLCNFKVLCDFPFGASQVLIPTYIPTKMQAASGLLWTIQIVAQEYFTIKIAYYGKTKTTVNFNPLLHNGGGLPCRPWEAKGGALRRLRPATEPQLTVVSESGNPHGLTLVILLRQRTGRAGNMKKERAGESGEERERREAWREKCVSHKKQ